MFTYQLLLPSLRQKMDRAREESLLLKQIKSLMNCRIKRAQVLHGIIGKSNGVRFQEPNVTGLPIAAALKNFPSLRCNMGRGIIR